MIDPCSGRYYGLKGECLQGGCTLQLIRLFANQKGDNTFFLPAGYALKEFQPPIILEGKSIAQQFETALSIKAYNTFKKMVMGNQVDVLAKLSDGGSLLEYYVKKGNWGEFEEFIQLTKSIDRKTLADEHLLELAMGYNKFQIAHFIVSLGTPTDSICEITSEFDITKLEILGCQAAHKSAL